MTGRTWIEGQVIHVADLAADPEYEVTEAVTLGGVRTLLGVPLLREGDVAGVIILGRTHGCSRSPTGRSSLSAPSPIRR